MKFFNIFERLVSVSPVTIVLCVLAASFGPVKAAESQVEPASSPPDGITPIIPPATDAAMKNQKQGAVHLAAILGQSWAGKWRGATLKETRRVDPKPGQTFATGLPAVWHSRIAGPDGKTGYIMWAVDGEGGLSEFALDGDFQIDTPDGRALTGVPPLQQFPLPHKNGSTIASGCVPTSAASVLGFWIAKQQPAWQGASGKDAKHLLPDLTRRLRARLSMEAYPDKDGFTSDGMSLAGAMPQDLARAIQADADEHKIPVISQFHDFSFSLLQSEIKAGRPVLLSCTVRVPHKPELSWGHEVAAPGWLTLAGVSFAGISDNFYPVKHPETLRWIRRDAFHSLITIKPIAMRGQAAQANRTGLS